MEAMLPILIQSIAPIAGTIITTLVSWGLLELRKFISSKTKSQQVNDALAHISHTAETIVMELEQTVVPYYVRNNTDGKLTKDQMEAVKKMAMSKVINQLPAEILSLANQAVNSLNGLISGKIEKAVYGLK